MTDIPRLTLFADRPRHPFPARGPQDVQRIVTMPRGMLPDLKIEIESLVAEGDLVVQPVQGNGDGHKGLHGKAGDGKDDHHERDADVPIRRRQDRRELDRARRARNAAAVRPFAAGGTTTDEYGRATSVAGSV